MSSYEYVKNSKQMASKNCKKCGQEFGSKISKCPQCGAYQKNWFMRHKILSTFGVFFILLIFIGLIGSQQPSSTDTSENTTSTDTSEVNDNVVKFGDGSYLVGKELPSGIYKATLTDDVMNMGYIERASDVDMEMDSIIANIILTGDGYVEIKPTDKAVKLQGVEITPIDLKMLKPNFKNEVSGGIYLVGFDIKPGTYKVEVTDTTTGMGYVERSRNVSMGADDIIANEIIQGQGYVKVKSSDFAIRVQGAKLTFTE